jgi:hypothetical protein
MKEIINQDWQSSNLQVFWGDIAPCDHTVQIYENENSFLATLEGFIGSGIIAGDSVIIIATAEHLLAIEGRLRRQGFDMEYLSATDRYIALEANEMLSKFMVNGWPDEDLFFELINTVLKRAQKGDQKARAFGEMVALLWQQGFREATIQLESLWNQLHSKKEFTLFCAYSKNCFSQDLSPSIQSICSEHTKIIDGRPGPSTEIYYKATA